ncbi:MAG TPA: hypothetical protein VMU50_05250, partial [Polyangia bacterium]|nr:hypothetical protein [Polyangia bacterium]
MSDWLLQLGTNPRARRLTKTLGLPLPLPQTLRRASGPWEERPLGDQAVVLGTAGGRALVETAARALIAAGADLSVVGPAPPALAEL